MEARLQALDANWSRFEAQHDKIVTAHWDALADNDYRKTDMLNTAEEAYLTQKGMFFDVLRILKSKQDGEKSASVTETAQAPRTTLPRIQLP